MPNQVMRCVNQPKVNDTSLVTHQIEDGEDTDVRA